MAEPEQKAVLFPSPASPDAAVRLRSVLRWKSDGLSNREVAHRLGVSEKAVRKVLRQAGWVPGVGLGGDHQQRIQTRRPGRAAPRRQVAAASGHEVSDTQLNIVLAPLSSPHRTRAITALCEELNRAPVRFPGTRLRLHYAIAGPR